MSATYLDVPDDIAGQYRHHAMLIADGAVPKPERVLLIDLLADGTCIVRAMGPDAPPAETCASFDDAIRAMADY